MEEDLHQNEGVIQKDKYGSMEQGLLPGEADWTRTEGHTLESCMLGKKGSGRQSALKGTRPEETGHNNEQHPTCLTENLSVTGKCVLPTKTCCESQENENENSKAVV